MHTIDEEDDHEYDDGGAAYYGEEQEEPYTDPAHWSDDGEPTYEDPEYAPEALLAEDLQNSVENEFEKVE